MGDLLPRHMQIFRQNEFFAGVTLPMPDVREPLESKMVKTSRETLDFLYKCLDRDPAKRWTCDQLMRHQYFNGFTYRLPPSELEEFEKLRRSNYSNGSSTLFPHLSNTVGSPSDQMNPSAQQQHTSQSYQQQYPSGNKSYVQRDSRESFDHLPNI